MSTCSAALNTKAASKQTYYTLRLLADREHLDDAFRAYAYFRWVDDVLDTDTILRLEPGMSKESGRRAFIDRQKSLLESCYRDESPQIANDQEYLLVELIRHDHEEASGLQSYLRNMMQVLDFDAMRQGRLISQVELTEYTRWLAIAVTEAMHYFIGNGRYAPQDETRYLAVSAAHITHLLRDTFEDVQVGYFNIPREELQAYHIKPQDVNSEAYVAWVRGRVLLAREYFKAGRIYLSRVQSLRCRLAGYAYIARFEWLLDTIEKDGYRLRPRYDDGKLLRTGLRMSWLAFSALINL